MIMAKQPTNLTGIKKGDTLYFVNIPNYYDNHGVVEATITRVTTTSDYILAHVVYPLYHYHAEKPEMKKDVALYVNKKEQYLRSDLRELFYFKRQDAQDKYSEIQWKRRHEAIGVNLAAVFKDLQKC